MSGEKPHDAFPHQRIRIKDRNKSKIKNNMKDFEEVSVGGVLCLRSKRKTDWREVKAVVVWGLMVALVFLGWYFSAWQLFVGK
jgi:hypothetical protein